MIFVGGKTKWIFLRMKQKRTKRGVVDDFVRFYVEKKRGVAFEKARREFFLRKLQIFTLR